MHRDITTARSQRGFSVVELMIAMVIGLILTAGVLQVFTSSRATYRFNEQLARLQENERIAADMIQNDVRQAGYQGCAKQVPFTNTLNSSTTVQWNFAVPLQGHEASGAGAWLPAIDTGAVVSPRAGSDILALRIPVRGAGSVALSSNMSTPTDTLKTAAGSPTPFAVGDVVMLSDCKAAAVFQVTGHNSATGEISHDAGAAALNKGPGNASNDLGHAFRAKARIMPIETVIYYLRDNDDGEPSLWRRAGGAPAEEVVEGIESMQVLYGEDTNNDRQVDTYVKANSVSDWTAVLSIRVGLLLRSVDEFGGATDNRTYRVLDATIGPAADRRQRLVLTTTATLRNRTI